MEHHQKSRSVAIKELFAQRLKDMHTYARFIYLYLYLFNELIQTYLIHSKTLSNNDGANLYYRNMDIYTFGRMLPSMRDELNQNLCFCIRAMSSMWAAQRNDVHILYKII